MAYYDNTSQNYDAMAKGMAALNAANQTALDYRQDDRNSRSFFGSKSRGWYDLANKERKAQGVSELIPYEDWIKTVDEQGNDMVQQQQSVDPNISAQKAFNLNMGKAATPSPVLNLKRYLPTNDSKPYGSY